MHTEHIFLILAAASLVLSLNCRAPRHAPEEVRLVNFVQTLVQGKLPVAIPTTLSTTVNGSNLALSNLMITSAKVMNADMQIPQPDTILMEFSNLIVGIGFSFVLTNPQGMVQNGTATMSIQNVTFHYTAALLVNDFKGVASDLKVGDVALQTNNNAILSVWGQLKPQIITGLQTTVPQFVLSLDAQVISKNILPLITLVEPIMVAPISVTNFGFTFTISNLAFTGIMADLATMQKGPKTNTADFEIVNLAANSSVMWSLNPPFFNIKGGAAMMSIAQTNADSSFEFGIDNNNQFTYQLFSTNLNVGSSNLVLENASSGLQKLIDNFKPLVVKEIESQITSNLCSFINNPNNIPATQ